MSVPRRVFLHGLGSAATVGLVTTPVATSHRVLPADVNPIEHFQHLREVLIENDELFGPRQVIPIVREQIGIMQQLRSIWRGADHRELIRVQAQYTQFHGWLYKDAGENHLAESCVDRALGLSQMAEDHELTGYLLACKAQIAVHKREPDAIGAAEQALRMSVPGGRTATVAATFTGHGYALSGDHVAMERAYDRARELLGTTDDAPDCPCRTWWLDDNRITLERAWSLTALGDYHCAAQSFLDAIAGMPGRYRRGRGVWLARAALASAGDRQVEHAATLGLDALAIGTETRSAGILTELARLDNALTPWNTVPAVANFRTAMKDTISRQA